MTRGVVIGKFYPPHRGHDFLIDAATAQVDELFVLVCDKADQAVRGSLRAAWLREEHPRAKVLVVPDELPDDDSAAWATFTVETLGFAPDVVFTSEDYGDRYASLMGAKHVLVDRQRTSVPISATAIRADPLTHWEHLSPGARAHFAVRVVIVGAESTGTITLTQALADHYDTVWVPEFGRTYSEGKMASSTPWRSDEFVFIARVQNEMEDLLARSCHRILFCDTDSFATGIWHERYMGCPSAEVKSLARGREPALYIVTDVDIPFVQDGLRDGEHIREWMHGRFVEALTDRGASLLVVSGSVEERVRASIGVCDRLLATPRPVE